MTRLSVALVLPYGDAREGYFPDTLLELCTTEARRAGHDAALCRVYYDAEHPELARAGLSRWLEDQNADVVVVERLFDPAPLRQHCAERPGRHTVLLSWGDADLAPGADLVLGIAAGTTPTGRTRRSPAAGDLVAGFRALIDALASGTDPLTVPGVMRVGPNGVEVGTPLTPAPLPTPFEPALDAEVIGEGPRITRRAIFGNAGCPFALDPAENRHYRGLVLAPSSGLSRLGCAFCHAGGDYQMRPDEEVVGDLVLQASYFIERSDTRELLIVDQHPVRYLEALVRAASHAGLGSVRWLFPARVDSFVRDRARLEGAIVAAEENGQVLELYLSGFESFSDEELSRYNKGVSARELVSGVECMRELRELHPDSFDYARTKGHSLVLWNPWTRLENVEESIARIREHGLGELFDEIGHNRLRLYPDLPIARAAERDGAVLEDWESGDEGAARKKGYAREQPWKFLDSRTRLAWELARRLRARLGTETEVEQISAALGLARDQPFDANVVEEVLGSLERLDGVLESIARRGSGERAAVVEVSGPCNNGCAHCPNRVQFHDELLLERIGKARQSGRPVIFGGREPTLRRDIAELVARARGDDRRPVGIVTNGRRFAHLPFAAFLAESGLRFASVKLFATNADIADAISRDPDGYAQALAGIANCQRAGISVELRVRLDRRILAELEDFATLAHELGVPVIRIEPALDAVGLAHLDEAVAAVKRLESSAEDANLALTSATLSAGAHCFDRMPISN